MCSKLINLLGFPSKKPRFINPVLFLKEEWPESTCGRVRVKQSNCLILGFYNMVENKEPELKYLVRVADTDLNGKMPVVYALARIKGVGYMFANAVCRAVSVDGTKRIGALADEEIKKLDNAIRNPQETGLPRWMLNRRFDPETGQDKHLLTSDLQFAIENDIKFMKKTKTYKGVRHMLGQPVRGQRTRSNFRVNKGKVMGVRVSAGAKKGGKTG